MTPSREARRVLVINVARIGDTLLATPALHAIHTACNDGKLTVLAHPSRLELLRHLPFIQQLAPITKTRASWMTYFALRQRYDWAFVYGHDAALIRYALRVARHTIAFRQPDDHLNRRLFAAIERPSVPIHAVHERLLLPAAAGIATDDLRLHYHVTSEERAIASERLAALFPDEEGPLVGLQMVSFSTKSYRDWPPGHFQEFVNELRSSHPSTRFLIFGGKESRPLAKIFRRNFGLRVASLAGELSLRESAALMSLLNLYVGVDTGPTHLAGALGVPMVALYHCRHRGHHLAPLQHAHLAVIEHPAPDDTCDTHRTMAEIGVAEVTRAARRILAETLY